MKHIFAWKSIETLMRLKTHWTKVSILLFANLQLVIVVILEVVVVVVVTDVSAEALATLCYCY